MLGPAQSPPPPTAPEPPPPPADPPSPPTSPAPPPADPPPATTGAQPPPVVAQPPAPAPPGVVALAPPAPGRPASNSDLTLNLTPAPVPTASLPGGSAPSSVPVPAPTPGLVTLPGPDAAARPRAGFRALSVSRRLGSRGVLVLRYRLTAPARLVLGIRGRGPSCRLVGEIQLVGLPGSNSVALPGRLRLPGTYLLSPRPPRGGEDLAHVLLTILPPGKTTGTLVRPRCRGARSVAVGETSFTVAGPSAAPPSAVPPRARSRQAPRASGVLGAALPALDALPPPASEEVSAGPGMLAVALVLAATLSLIGMFVVVRRELRPHAVEVMPRGYRPSEPGGWVATELGREPDVRDRSELVVEADVYGPIRRRWNSIGR